MNTFKQFRILLTIALALFAFSSLNAQLTPNTFGIYGQFGTSFEEAGIVYTLSENIELDLGVGFKNVSYTVDEGDAPESESQMSFYLWGGYFLTKGDVSPYLGLGIDYTAFPEPDVKTIEYAASDIELEFCFGIQTHVTKNLAFNIEIGAAYDMFTRKREGEDGKEYKYGENTFNLFTGAIGATFYLGD